MKQTRAFVVLGVYNMHHPRATSFLIYLGLRVVNLCDSFQGVCRCIVPYIQGFFNPILCRLYHGTKEKRGLNISHSDRGVEPHKILYLLGVLGNHKGVRVHIF